MGSVATTALLLSLDNGRLGWLGRALSIRPLLGYGSISYGVYLLHGMVIEVVNTHFRIRPVPRFLLVLAISTLLGMLSWRWFERPLLALAPPHAPLPDDLATHRAQAT
jgi:peptidoglycan/LPS O-acetylase OafA/YrhL